MGDALVLADRAAKATRSRAYSARASTARPMPTASAPIRALGFIPCRISESPPFLADQRRQNGHAVEEHLVQSTPWRPLRAPRDLAAIDRCKGLKPSVRRLIGRQRGAGEVDLFATWAVRSDLLAKDVVVAAARRTAIGEPASGSVTAKQALSLPRSAAAHRRFCSSVPKTTGLGRKC